MKMEKETSKNLMEKVQTTLKERGQKAFEIAKNAILHEKITNKLVYEALCYFMEESWYDVQHPALLSLACEAVGGRPNKTFHIGSAMVLLAGAADIHDDIIDKSETKGSKPTIFGKYGKDIALLAGDALLYEGLTLLHEACEKLPEKQRRTILNLTKKAFFEIGSAEAKETSFKAKYDVPPKDYYDVIKMKAAVAEANAHIGAILGKGMQKEINMLGHYGRTLGILMTIRDDFIDIFEPYELENRVRNECLPIPILYALKNVKAKKEIFQLLRKEKIREEDAYTIVDVVLNTKEVQKLKQKMYSMIKKENNNLVVLKKTSITDKLQMLLLSTVVDL